MKRVQVLVTGLCLSRNRGGPAMALTFIEQIRKHVDAEFTFAVTPVHMDLEGECAARYGVNVVPSDTLLVWLTTRPPIQFIRWLKNRLKGKPVAVKEDIRFWNSVHRDITQAYREADCVVNLNGIAFVGDGTRSWSASLEELTPSIYARLYRKPFYRFIQSYGPLKDWRVRLIARYEFKRLPCVMARGELSAASCRTVAGNVPVYALPDVAITLPCADEGWTRSFLDQIGFKRQSYIVLSPSAVIASIPAQTGSSVGPEHAQTFALIAQHYLAAGEHILFLPHMTSPDLSQCDRRVCRQALEILKKGEIDTSRCHIIDDELDCRELKSLISKAKLAIVARYHALVAALSSGVPAVSIGWNDKYEDLLEFYHAAPFAIDARSGNSSQIAEAVITKAQQWRPQEINIMRRRQTILEEKVHQAGKNCSEWILASLRWTGAI